MGKKGKASKPAALTRKVSAAEAKFVEGLLARGEAVPLSDGTDLPPGATHRVVPDEGGKKVKRERFSAR